jgi:hypothetical protein
VRRRAWLARRVRWRLWTVDAALAVDARNRRERRTRVIYSLPSSFDILDGAGENAYALDVARGRFATKNYVYELDRYSIVAPTIAPTADQIFFDASGTLWFLAVSNGSLTSQTIGP